MTECTQRTGPDLNFLHHTSPHFTMSPYANGDSYNSYFNNNGPVHYPTMSSSYSNYGYLPHSNHMPATMCLPSSNTPAHYQSTARFLPPSIPSRVVPSNPSYPMLASSRSHSHGSRGLSGLDSMADTESQDSINAATMLSEALDPPLEGYPCVFDFDNLMQQYVSGLSTKKQDKALIHARRAANIKIVLIDKKTTSVESAQFRFWVKKMFTLLPSDPKIPDKQKKICHEGKPVAVREKLFKILTLAHKQCQHGGRDKTSAQVRRVYSWVPKELISRFVKICPTCQQRRGTTRSSCAEGDERQLDTYNDSPSECISSSSYQNNMSTITEGLPMMSPIQMSSYSSSNSSRHKWLNDLNTDQKQATNRMGELPHISRTYSNHSTYDDINQSPSNGPHHARNPIPFTTINNASQISSSRAFDANALLVESRSRTPHDYSSRRQSTY